MDDRRLTFMEVRALLATFLVGMFVAAIFQRIRFDADRFYDFLSYALPCAAALCAGAGAYLRGDKEANSDWLFQLAIALLYAGLMCYVRTKACWESVELLLCLTAAVGLIPILLIRWLDEAEDGTYLSAGVKGAVLGVLIAAVILIGAAFFIFYVLRLEC